MRWDDTLKEIVKKLSEKYAVPEEDIKYAVDHFFRHLKKCMQLKNMPKILIHNFGTFRTSVKNIDFKRGLLKARMEEGKMDKEKYLEIEENLSKIRKRIILEQPTGFHNYIRDKENLDEKTSDE